MEKIFETFETRFERFKNRKHVEMEFRFGKMCKGSFNTDVGKISWDRVLKALEKYTGWEAVKKSLSTVYSLDDKRIIVDNVTADTDSHIKKRVFQKDFKMDNQPLDVRLSISQETPSEHTEEMDTIRNRTRTSFIRKNVSIDMTIVDNKEFDSEEDKMYHIELEIIDPLQVKDLK